MRDSDHSDTFLRERDSDGGLEGEADQGITTGFGQAPPVPVTLTLVLRSIRSMCVFGMGAYLWYNVAVDLSKALVDTTWHPIAAVLVYQTWLAALLVIGLTAIDYTYLVCYPQLKVRVWNGVRFGSSA